MHPNNDPFKDMDLDSLSPEEAAQMREAFADLDALQDEGYPLPDELSSPPAAILDDMSATKRALKRLPIVVMVILTFVLGTGIGMGLRPSGWGFLLEAGSVVLIALGLMSMYHGIKLGSLSPRLGVALLAGAALMFSGLSLLEVKAAGTISNVAWNQGSCVMALFMWAIPGMAGLLWALWGAKLPTPTTGALLGAGLGFFSATFLHLHCPLISPLHLLMHHGGGIALMTLMGAAAAFIFSRWTLARGV